MVAVTLGGILTPVVGAESPPKPLATVATAAKPLPAMFDPKRHMALSEIKPGMKGYGLTVYAGSQIRKFDIEVIAILRNIFGPDQDAILIRCVDDYMKHTGPVEGMSGSPIYIVDDTGENAGNARMIGAFAYGWEAQKDPIAGVQPIENMLGLTKPKEKPNEPVAGVASAATYSLLDADVIPSVTQIRGLSVRDFLRGKARTPRFDVGHDRSASGLVPMSTPLAVSGLSTEAMALLSESLTADGNGSRFTVRTMAGGAMTGGAMTGPPAPADADFNVPDTIEPGGTLIAPVITGDLDAAAVGTATEVINGRVMGFGHPFNGDGPISMPMATGTIATIIASNTNSFKLGATGKFVGTIDYDTTFGIAGQLGAAPPMIPITVNLKFTDGTSRTFNYNAAWHPRLTPRLAAMAVMGSALQRHNLPFDFTLDYHIKLEFGQSLVTREASRVIEFSNIETSLQTEGLVRQVAGPIIAMTDNPFGKLVPRRVTLDMNVLPGVKLAEIRQLAADRSTYRPGQTVKLSMNVRKHLGNDLSVPLRFELPADLKDGVYQLTVSDAQTHTAAEIAGNPAAFDTRSAEDIAQVISEFSGKRNDAAYLRLTSQMPEIDIAIGRSKLPGLPGSMRSRLATTPGPDMKPGTRSLTTVVASDMVLSGTSQVTIRVDRKSNNQ